MKRSKTKGQMKSILNQKKPNCLDRISSLPDSLLLHILSFLIMEDAINTSLLSRRWRYLWTWISIIDFGTPNQRKFGKMDTVAYINRSLLSHQGSTISKFHVCFKYNVANLSYVDSWIQFATRRKVADLDIDFSNGDGESGELVAGVDLLYKLPRCIFYCQSIREMHLVYCDLNLPTSINLPLLTTISLSCLELASWAIGRLTSGCPCLESLFLLDCNKSNPLKIDSRNTCLKTLRIQDNTADEKIEIFSKSLVSIEFFGDLQRLAYQVLNLSSLVTATFYFEDLLYYENYEYVAINPDGIVLAKLLNDLSHAKDLKLCSWCLQILAIREVQSLDDSSSFDARNLHLLTEFLKWELPGIAYLLRSCPKLNSLIIFIRPKQGIKLESHLSEKYNFEEKEFWNRQELSLFPMFQHLTTVEIYFFKETEEFMKELDFIKFLLKNSRVMEKMTIYNAAESDSDELMLCRKILCFPRCSPNAEVIFSSD